MADWNRSEGDDGFVRVPTNTKFTSGVPDSGEVVGLDSTGQESKGSCPRQLVCTNTLLGRPERFSTPVNTRLTRRHPTVPSPTPGHTQL